jgi:hypothetical protein
MGERGHPYCGMAYNITQLRFRKCLQGSAILVDKNIRGQDSLSYWYSTKGQRVTDYMNLNYMNLKKNVK